MPSDERFDEPFEPAEHYLEARIEDRPGNLLQKGVRWAIAAAAAASTGDAWGTTSTIDLVVSRKATGIEVIRAPAGHIEEADLLLQRVRSDLATKTVEQFVSEWYLPSSPPPADA